MAALIKKFITFECFAFFTRQYLKYCTFSCKISHKIENVSITVSFDDKNPS